MLNAPLPGKTPLTDKIDEQTEHVVDGEECGVHHVGVQPQRRVRLDHRQAVQHRLLVRPERRARQTWGERHWLYNYTQKKRGRLTPSLSHENNHGRMMK